MHERRESGNDKGRETGNEKGSEPGKEKGRMAQCDANEDKRKLLGILSVRGP